MSRRERATPAPVLPTADRPAAGPRRSRARAAPDAIEDTAAAPSPRSPARRDSYHHGALREALIEAAEQLLAERGLEGFSLREVARRSGVSPAAPAHHFGDTAGLLHAVTVIAFDGLTAALRAGDARGGDDPIACLREQGLGYVGFALDQPGRFGLMFSIGAVRRDEALLASANAAYGVLQLGIRRLRGLATDQALGPDDELALMSTWSVVHGFAHLALAGQFDAPGIAQPADQHAARRALLTTVLGPMLEQQLRGLLAGRGASGTDGRAGVATGSTPAPT